MSWEELIKHFTTDIVLRAVLFMDHNQMIQTEDADTHHLGSCVDTQPLPAANTKLMHYCTVVLLQLLTPRYSFT